MMTRVDVAKMIRKIADLVESGDSAEGSVQWLLSEEPHELDVIVNIRTGNLDGQGSIESIDTTQRKPSKVDQRRLRDGAAALALDMNVAMLSKEKLLELRKKLYNGAVALQSMDDLGSEEANAKAARDLEELSRRIKLVDAFLSRKTAT